jgi:hypothetical protein
MRMTVAIAGLVALLLSQALAQQSTSPVPPSASDQPPAHCGPASRCLASTVVWSITAGIANAVSCLPQRNNTIEIVDSWRRVHITGLSTPKLPSMCQA